MINKYIYDYILDNLKRLDVKELSIIIKNKNIDIKITLDPDNIYTIKYYYIDSDNILYSCIESNIDGFIPITESIPRFNIMDIEKIVKAMFDIIIERES